jgi:hypothetical protein
MVSLKRISPWIACLALLLNLLAMPMSQATQPADVPLMLWGGFCSGSPAQALPADFDTLIDVLPPGADNNRMQHGDCCCGHGALAALPGDYHRHCLPRYSADIALASPILPTLHPRVRWPSLTPRASPGA